MAIALTALTSGEGQYGTSYTTASITPTANSIVFLAVTGGSASKPTSITGNGLTWVEVASHTATGDNGDFYTILYRAMDAAPTTGSITITWTADVTWNVFEFSGVDTSGTNGSGAVVQSASSFTAGSGSGTTALVTLAAFSDVNNATVGVFGNNSYGAVTVGSGFTQIQEVGSNVQHQFSEWKSTNDTSVDAVDTASYVDIIGIALELKIASSGTAYTQAVAGTLTLSGVQKRLTSILLSSSIVLVGILAKVSRKKFVGSIAASGTAGKQRLKLLLGSITAAGNLAYAAVFTALITGALSATGSLSRRTARALAGALTTAGSIAKVSNRLLVGTLSATGGLFKRVGTALAGIITGTGVLSSSAVLFKTITGSLTLSGIVSGIIVIIPTIVYHAKRLYYRMLGRR